MTASINGTTGVTFPDASVQGTAATGFGFKNRIINGAMMIAQRSTASVTAVNSYNTVDRWSYWGSQTSKFTQQQNLNSVTPPVGFSKYLGNSVASAVSIGAADYFFLQQNIEGQNVADLAWGTANAQTVTLSFWVRSSVTGAFGGSVENGASTTSYPFGYTITSANTWEQKTVTIPGPTTGSFATDNTTGIGVNFSLGMGSNSCGTANTWAATRYLSPTGCVSLVGTSGATFYITGVQLEKGSTATSFDYRPYGTELALCQRYYQTSIRAGVAVADGASASLGSTFSAYSSSNGYVPWIAFPVAMRSAPSVTFYRGSVAGTNGQWNYYISGAWVAFTATTVNDSTTGGFNMDCQKSGVFTTASSYLVLGNYAASSEL